MGFGGGGSGSFVLPDHTHSSVLEDGGELERLVTKVDTETLEKFPAMQLLGTTTLGSANANLNITSLSLSADDYAYFEIVFATKKTTGSASSIVLQINGLSAAAYSYEGEKNATGTITGFTANAQTSFLLGDSSIATGDVNNHIVGTCKIILDPDTVGSDLPRFESGKIQAQWTTLSESNSGFYNAVVTTLTQVNLIYLDADTHPTGSTITLYGVKRS
ncbi:MAG: hypothetical protein HOK72_00470 [Flavobacteriales bacterium]|nr:hypothetical protein [Flavobacteriales bacterium]